MSATSIARRDDQEHEDDFFLLMMCVTAAASTMKQKIPCAPNPPPLKVTWHSRTSPFTNAQFKQRYRVSREEFDELLQTILFKFPNYAGSFSHNGLDVRLKLASCLRFLAGGAALDCMDLHGQRKSTFYAHLQETLEVLERTLKIEWIWNDEEKLRNLERRCSPGGATRNALAGCIGYIDGIIIKTRKPRRVHQAHDFYCARKNCWGLNAQAICDSQLVFTYFNLGSGGATHDSTAFKCSMLGAICHAGELPGDYFFIGDAAYGGGMNVMTPYSSSTARRNRSKDDFNYLHSSKRMAIERAFGVLVRRWGHRN